MFKTPYIKAFFIPRTLASERTSIHKNLVVAIGLAQIIFLAGIDATYNPVSITIIVGIKSTYPFLKSTLTLTYHLGQNCDLRER